MAVWNPFDDATPFCQLSEDHLFGAEFDRIRRGSQSSECRPSSSSSRNRFRFDVERFVCRLNIEGIANVKSRESLVMSAGVETLEDPFGAAPFRLPGTTSIRLLFFLPCLPSFTELLLLFLSLSLW